MKIKKENAATLGLLMITVWAAMQYILLKNVPDTVSTFSFLFITNLVGFIVLAAVQPKKLKLLNKKVLLKGIILTVELIGYNFFMILGSRGLDSVIVSSLVSMYFIFVTPMLLLLRKKVSFRAAIASVVAILSLLLMFNADLGTLFSSKNVFFLIIADLFFAAYVVTIPIVGENEDSSVLTISQMLFSALFALAGWAIEVGIGVGSFSFPADTKFWITVLFIGVFIRAIYGILQISCQRYVKPVNASLIFSSEIIITLITNPIVSRLMGTSYTPATNYQIIGCVLFVIAVMIVDDTIMGLFGYTDMDTKVYTDQDGNEKIQSTLSKKLINMTLVMSMLALVVSAVICISAITSIRTTSVEKSTLLGQEAAQVSEKALKKELENKLTTTATDKAMIAEAKLKAYIESAEYAADYAAELYNAPSDFSEREVLYPVKKNTGIWAMQRLLADQSISYAEVEKENKLLGNMERVFGSIVEHSDNISTIYIGTETGLIISYDPNSEYADLGVENYYEFRNSEWYADGKKSSAPFFTKAYQDSYGRGLTITCVAPIYDAANKFRGCIGIDILMNDINSSMVNDHIVEPSYATLIDSEGYIISSKDVDETSSGTTSIFDENVDTPIKDVSDKVLSNADGIAQKGKGDEAIYIAYSKIPLTEWTLCIMSPVKNIIEPALEIKDNIDTNTEQVSVTVYESIRVIIMNCLVLFAVIILVITFFVGKRASKITAPLKNLEYDVLEISKGKFDKRTEVMTDDEIGSLARTFNDMTESLQKYIADLKEVTAREERIASELSVATKIQADMLPSKFPAYPERHEFDIYATMAPAKEVGGDFYDFFLVDENHLAMVIADVSGKGVPAALFMVISKTLIKNQALAGLSPKDILMTVNNQLCANNEAEMFVTVWLGIVDLRTGEMTAANAGHEYPVICKAGGQYELFKDKHGFVLAGMENSRYREYELQFENGDRLFVYTDGVAEATNVQSELYGTKRLVDTLNRNTDAGCEEIVHRVRDDIDNFVGEAEQFDDITMVCFQYMGE